MTTIIKFGGREYTHEEFSEWLFALIWKNIRYSGECNMMDSYCIMHQANNKGFHHFVNDAVKDDGTPDTKVITNINVNFDKWEAKYECDTYDDEVIKDLTAYYRKHLK